MSSMGSPLANPQRRFEINVEVTHESRNQVKESKISIQVHNYELFKMKPDETIDSSKFLSR